MMNHSLMPTGCRSQLRRPASGSTPVRNSIASLSSVSSILQCAALACRTEIIPDAPPDFWCVADCLEIANGELWRTVEALQGVADRVEPESSSEAAHDGKECASEDRTEGAEETDDDQDAADSSDQDDGGRWIGPDDSSRFVAMI